MPKFFDRIAELNPLDDVADKVEGSLRRVGSAATPNFVERRVPQSVKDALALQATMALVPVAAATDPKRTIKYIDAILASDALAGRSLAETIIPRRGGPGPVNFQGIAAEVLRPSNLVPVSKAGTVLKMGGRFGRPLIRELGKEAAVASAFSAAETLRTGGSTEEAVAAGIMGAGIGGVTPIGFHLAGRGAAKLLGNKVADVAEETVEAAIPGKKPKRLSRATPEEQIAATRPTTPQEVISRIRKDIESHDIRIGNATARLRSGLGRRPTTPRARGFLPPTATEPGRKGDRSVYADDILNVDGKFYPVHLLEADAGELEAAPLIHEGTFTLPSKRKGKGKKFYLSPQDAENLRDLYARTSNPSVTEIRQELEESAGRAVRQKEGIWETELDPTTGKSVQARLSPEGNVETRDVTRGKTTTTKQVRQGEQFVTEEGEEFSVVYGSWRKSDQPPVESPQEFETLMGAGGFTNLGQAEVRPIDDAYALRVKTYFEQHGQTFQKPKRRPVATDSKEYRKAVHHLNDINDEILKDELRLEEIQRSLATENRRVDARRKLSKEPERLVREQLGNRLKALDDAITTNTKINMRNLPPAQQAAARREFESLSAERQKVEESLKDLPEELVEAARAQLTTGSGKDAPKAISRLGAEARLLQERVAQNRHQRAKLLGTDAVPGDPVEQKALLADKFGELQDDLPPPLPPTMARDVLERYREADAAFRAKAQQSLDKENVARQRKLQLIEAIESGKLPGLPYADRMTALAHAYGNYLDKIAYRDRAAIDPSLLNRPARATESLSNLANLAMIESYARALGSHNPPVTALRNLAERLVNLHSTQDGLGGRAFIVGPDGERAYGSLKMVQPTTESPENWVVDFVPDFTKSRFQIPELRVKDIQVEYRRNPDTVTPKGVKKGFDALSKRLEFELESIRDVRSEEGTRVLRGSPEAIEAQQNLTTLRQTQLTKLQQPTIEEADLRTMADLNGEIDAAWVEVQSHLMPIVPNLPDSPDMFSQRVQEGYNALLRRPLSTNKKVAAQQVLARREVLQTQRQYLIDKSGATIDDPIVEPLLDQLGDPVQLDMYMMARGFTDDDLLGRRGTKIGRRTQGALDFVTGYSYKDDAVANINTMYQWDRNGISDHIMTEWNSYIQALRQVGLQEYKGQKLTRRSSALRFADGDRELEAISASSFDPTIRDGMEPEVANFIARAQKLDEPTRAALFDIVSREIRWLLDYTDDLFPNAPAAVKNIAKIHRAAVKRVADLAIAQTDRKVSNGYLNRMMLDQKLWDHIDQKLLQEGHPLEVLVAAAESASEKGYNLRDVLVTGEGLLRAEPLAFWTSVQDTRLKEAIIRLGGPDSGITSTDVTHLPHRWAIKSRDKFKVKNADGTTNTAATKNLQDSIAQLERGLNRLPDWGGLEGLSRAISSMVLTLDANIVSVQGYAAMSSRIMFDLARIATGRGQSTIKGADSIGQYMKSLRMVMSDEGYHAWRRSRAEDIQYYAANGMTVGQKAFIAGPALSKFPLEDFPVIGVLPKFAREFNDLQFNRLLLYLKVTSIDMMLGKARQMRSVGRGASAGMLDLDGISGMVEQAAGTSAFFRGQPEDVVRAAIRSVNNKLGGLDLNAQGIGQYRQIAERIMTITPGFLRAQAGQLTTAISRPNTVEGWMAMTGIAEEVAFAMGVATLLSMMTGQNWGHLKKGDVTALRPRSELNVKDMTRADWMAVPFEDSYIPIIPRVGIPRLTARLLEQTINAAQGEGFDGGQAIQSFALGRMSPLVNAALGTFFFDEDFLGRRYRDKKDRVFAGLTSFMPIFVENLATEAREGVAEDGWGSLTSLTYNTPLQFMGKNLVPRPPIEKLDEIAMNYTSKDGGTPRKWFDLTALEQDALRQNPSTDAAFKDFEYYQQRRQSPKQQQVESAFMTAEQMVDRLRTQPVNISGVEMSMQDAYKLLLAGEMTGDEYRDRLKITNAQINAHMDGMEVRLKELGLDLDASSEEKQKRIREIFKDSDPGSAVVTLAVWDAQKVQPEDYTEEKVVVTPNGEVRFTETDWDEFFQAREDVLNSYPEDVRVGALNAMEKWEDEGVRAYRAASEKRQDIEDLPRYRGLSNDQADKIDAMTKSFRDLRDQVRAKIGLPGTIAPLPEGLNAVLRRFAIQQFAEQGFVKTEEDLQLAAFALMMEEEPLLREAMRGTEQLSALLSNPDVLRFYPYLLNRVPVWARGNLPEDLQPQFDINNAYQEVVG